MSFGVRELAPALAEASLLARVRRQVVDCVISHNQVRQAAGWSHDQPSALSSKAAASCR